MTVPQPAPGTVAVYSDIACPWATLFLHRFHAARRRLGLDGGVRLEHRPFPLELVNRRPTPRLALDAEIAVISGVAPDAGWRPWHRGLDTYPVTSLPALEAVQAVQQAQGHEAAEALDSALRRAFYVESLCISLVSVVVEVARHSDGVDADLVDAALADGRARSRVRRAPEGVEGSPSVVLPDGQTVFNPGVTIEMPDTHVPRIVADDAGAVDALLERAAG